MMFQSYAWRYLIFVLSMKSHNTDKQQRGTELYDVLGNLSQ